MARTIRVVRGEGWVVFKVSELRYPGHDLRWYDLEPPWRDDDAVRYARLDRNACRVQCGRRPKELDLTFLLTLQPLLGLELLGGPRQDQVAFSLPGLVRLTLYNRGLTPFNPEHLQKLGTLAIDYRPGLDRISECPELRSLMVWGWPGDDLSLVRHARPIEYLRILGRGQEFTFGGLDGPLRLDICVVDDMQPRSLAGIESQQGLKYLRIEGRARASTPAFDLEPLRQLRSLEWITLQHCGWIASLAPLRDLPLLAGVSLGSCDVVDGDLTPLIDLPPGAHVSFGARPHYSHTRDQVLRIRAQNVGDGA